MNLKNKLFEHDKTEGKLIVGTDEAGRGPAAGGVFAAAVFFNNIEIQKQLYKLNDSKKIPKKLRTELYDIILNNTINSIVCVEVEEIEKINILNSSLKAMKSACENVISKLKDTPLVLVDGNKLIKDFKYPQKFIIKGDGKSAAIAAASILAKVSRDKYMEQLGLKYPQYNWKNNAGYLTKEHINAINKHGITPHHRKLFLRKLFEEKNALQSN